AHFLREAGYLHLRGWLDPADMAVIAQDIDRALASDEEGDGRAWGSTLAGDEELVQAPVEGNCIEALAKPVGVATGISDVPWPRDCSLGGHPYKCGGTVVGISVTGGTEQTGLLRAVAGSHRAATLSEPTWGGNDPPVG